MGATKYCAICGSPFEVGPHNRRQKFCSDACYDKVRCPRAGPGRPAKDGRGAVATHVFSVPEVVWQERDRALREPLTLTQQWFGDPPLCRSALMKS